MSIIMTVESSETPRECIDYAQSHVVKGETICIFRKCIRQGTYRFIATSEDSNLQILTDSGYEMIELHSPDSYPIIDNPSYNQGLCC